MRGVLSRSHQENEGLQSHIKSLDSNLANRTSAEKRIKAKIAATNRSLVEKEAKLKQAQHTLVHLENSNP
jgi:cell division septum initiation protein DivIVA